MKGKIGHALVGIKGQIHGLLQTCTKSKGVLTLKNVSFKNPSSYFCKVI